MPWREGRRAPAYARRSGLTNLGLRPLGRYLDRKQVTSAELEVEYGIEVTCRDRDEAHLRASLLQAVAHEPLVVRRVRSEDVPETDKVRLEFLFSSEGRIHRTIEQVATRLGGEPGVTSVTWEATEERTDY